MSRRLNLILSRMRDLSIKTKLSLIALGTTAAALLVIGGVLSASEYLRYRDDTLSVLESHAQITAINAAAALAFDDIDSARQTLSALHVAPAIQSAQIYNASGTLFASFRRDASGPAPAAHAQAVAVPRVSLTQVTIDHPIAFSDSPIGFLRLEADFGGYLDSLRRFGAALLVAAVCALAAALWLVVALRDAVAGPIEGLAGLVARVRRDHDFSLRATVEGRDELGSLAESFNAMLGEVERRDAHLARERDLVEAILNTMDAAVLVVDGDARVVEVNGAFLRATGRQARDCIGMPVWEA
ncbi:MAG TPA: CHASE sensor domain-containing protein, partial [Usitatibacter sp.]